jgi:hypothetical protein
MARSALAWCAAVVFLLLAGTSSYSNAQTNADLSGWLIGRIGYGLDSDHDPCRLNQQLLQLEWKPPTLQTWQLDVKLWAEHETELEPKTTQELTLRKLTLQKEASHWALTLGKQIVLWGKADGFQLLNIVNPLDLREFVLGDDLRRRLPLWMVNAQLFPNQNQQIQFLLIPQTYHDRLPDPGGEFDLAATMPPGTELLPLQEPGNEPHNWSYGLRWKATFEGWGVSLIGLRNLAGTPVAFPSLTPQGRLQLQPQVVKRTVFGAAADWSTGAAVVRFELAYSPDEYRTFTSPEGIAFLKRKSSWRTLLGIDWYVHNWLISPQIFDVEADGQAGILSNPDGRFASILVERRFYYNKLSLRLFGASSLLCTDYWITLSARYQLRDYLEVAAEGDWLGGGRQGFFGQFDGEDRVVVEIKVFF